MSDPRRRRHASLPSGGRPAINANSRKGSRVLGPPSAGSNNPRLKKGRLSGASRRLRSPRTCEKCRRTHEKTRAARKPLIGETHVTIFPTPGPRIGRRKWLGGRVHRRCRRNGSRPGSPAFARDSDPRGKSRRSAASEKDPPVRDGSGRTTGRASRPPDALSREQAGGRPLRAL
jgi:hypothetical protein